MNNKKTKKMQDAITVARDYIEMNGFNRELLIHNVHYRTAGGKEAIALKEVELGRPFDEDELAIFWQLDRSGWVIQFVAVECEPGDTPQGPCVTVYDDGEIDAFRPL